MLYPNDHAAEPINAPNGEVWTEVFSEEQKPAYVVFVIDGSLYTVKFSTLLDYFRLHPLS